MVDARNLPEEVMAAAMGNKPEIQEDHLSEIIPAYARVQVPLRSKAKLVLAADQLRKLAFSLDQIASNTHIKDSSALYEAWREIRSTNSKLSPPTKYGKLD